MITPEELVQALKDIQDNDDRRALVGLVAKAGGWRVPDSGLTKEKELLLDISTVVKAISLDRGVWSARPEAAVLDRLQADIKVSNSEYVELSFRYLFSVYYLLISVLNELENRLRPEMRRDLLRLSGKIESLIDVEGEELYE